MAEGVEAVSGILVALLFCNLVVMSVIVWLVFSLYETLGLVKKTKVPRR